MRKNQVDIWRSRISEIQKELGGLGAMRPGSVSEQYNVCGTKNCQCKDKDNPIKHGPYYQLSYTFKGKSTSEFVKPENLSEVKEQFKNHKTFKALSSEWVELSVLIAKELKKQAKAKAK